MCETEKCAKVPPMPKIITDLNIAGIAQKAHELSTEAKSVKIKNNQTTKPVKKTVKNKKTKPAKNKSKAK